MNTIMNRSVIVFLFFAILLYSCNSGPSKQEMRVLESSVAKQVYITNIDKNYSQYYNNFIDIYNEYLENKESEILHNTDYLSSYSVWRSEKKIEELNRQINVFNIDNSDEYRLLKMDLEEKDISLIKEAIKTLSEYSPGSFDEIESNKLKRLKGSYIFNYYIIDLEEYYMHFQKFFDGNVYEDIENVINNKINRPEQLILAFDPIVTDSEIDNFKSYTYLHYRICALNYIFQNVEFPRILYAKKEAETKKTYQVGFSNLEAYLCTFTKDEDGNILYITKPIEFDQTLINI